MATTDTQPPLCTINTWYSDDMMMIQVMEIYGIAISESVIVIIGIAIGMILVKRWDHSEIVIVVKNEFRTNSTTSEMI